MNVAKYLSVSILLENIHVTMLLCIVTVLLVSSSNVWILSKAEISNLRLAAKGYLLPGNVRPLLYKLEVEPDFNTDTFEGAVDITVLTIFTQNTITLHTLELEIDESKLRLLDEYGNVVNFVSRTFHSNDDKQFYTIAFEEDLQEGRTYTLVIGSFTGILNEDNRGFYLAKYTKPDGTVRKLAVSDFEPASARKAFPCFDEPALKAQFDISIIRPKDYRSISNALLESTKYVSNERYRDVYQRTPLMSTYLVAFIVSDYAFVGAENQRVFGKPKQIAEGRGSYSLNAGINLLKILAEYIGVPYSLPKMDQFGLPEGYFKSGAMENWGLVTYRDTFLMYPSNRGTLEIISHELTHQWFGDLVTPVWWSYVWLSEGFATYFEYYAASIYDNYDFADRFVPAVVHLALRSDSSRSTRSMNQDVGPPRDLEAQFDYVSYHKSGSVLRMVEGILSEEVFRRGLNIYLNKMQFSAAQPSDLYSSWQQALAEARLNPLPDGEDVASVMKTWDSNAGYPLLTVVRNYTDGSIFLSQKRFLRSYMNNDQKAIWYIPISVATQSNPNFSNTKPRVWLTEKENYLHLVDLNPEDWLILNVQQSGFYRINYDHYNWYKIIDFLCTDQGNRVHPINRAQLIDDSFELAKYGIIDYYIPLDLSRYLVRETVYAPLQSFANALSYLDSRLSNSIIYEDFQKYVLEVLSSAFKAVGFDEQKYDSGPTRINRKNIIKWMCRYKNDDCQQYGLKKLKEWQTYNRNTIPRELQAPLLCAAMKLGHFDDWEFIYRKYMIETNFNVGNNLLNAMGCIENKNILNRFLMEILATEKNNTLTERLATFSSAYASGKSEITYLLKDNWAFLNRRLSTVQLSSLIEVIASKMSTQDQFNELQRLGLQLNAQYMFQLGLQTIKNNILWSEKYLPSISTWLYKKK